MDRRLLVRAGLALLLLASAAWLANSWYTSELGANSELREQSQLSMDRRTPIADPRNGTTVITTQSNEASGAEGALIAIGPDGTLRAYERRYDVYWDVDPVDGTESTVLYVATDHLNKSHVCGPGTGCTRMVVEELNITTGERNRLYARVTKGGRWHDVDRLDPPAWWSRTSPKTACLWSTRRQKPSSGSGGRRPRTRSTTPAATSRATTGPT